VFWNISGESQINLGLTGSKVKLYAEPGQKTAKISTAANGITLSCGDRQFLETNYSKDELIKAFRSLKKL
jgi:hypothetical protein